PARLLRFYLWQRLLRRRHRNQSVRHAQARQDTHGGDVMRRTFKVFSGLLSYPSAELQAAVPHLAAAIDREALLGQTAHILAALAERLRKRRSAYEAAFRA